MLTVAALVETFHRHIAAEVKAGMTDLGTARWYRSNLIPLAERHGSMPASELRPYNVLEVRHTNAFCRACKRLYKWAADEDLIGSNSLRKLKIPPCPQRERILSRGEFVRLLRFISKRYRWFLLVMRRTMMRPGEIRKLTWANVDLKIRCILLPKFKGQKLRRDKLKVREVPLDAWMNRQLGRWKHKRMPLLTDHVFGGVKPIPDGRIAKLVRDARGRAGLPDDVVPYTTRHTAATTAIRNGVSLSHLAGILGQARTSTTERYVHLNGQHLVDVIDQATSRPRNSNESPAKEVRPKMT